jgi:multiple sugar transport system substrate-binding protein
MANPTRRLVLRRSVGLATAGVVARPLIANAAAKTATVWWVQGFAQEEDVAFKNIVADYEKASGNTLMPFAPHRQKIVSAMTSGVVPDLFPNNPVEMLALYAWDNKLVDVSDVVETQKSQYSETALLTAFCYNSVEKQRSYYAVPYTCAVRRITSGGRSSRRQATESKTPRKPGTRTTTFSKRCKKSCAAKACAMSTAWASS